MAEAAEFIAECEAVAQMMRRLYAARLTTISGGNISLRLPGGRCAITPGGGDKAATRAEEIAVLTLDGDNLIPDRKPSSEYKMHLEIFRRCPRAQAIIHAHPPTATAFTALAEPIACDLTAEGHAILGEAARVPYAITGSRELADLAAEAARTRDCLLLQNHGVVTLGATLLEAFNRMEVLEAAAWQTVLARGLGGARHLSGEELRDLDRLYGRNAAQP